MSKSLRVCYTVRFFATIEQSSVEMENQPRKSLLMRMFSDWGIKLKQLSVLKMKTLLHKDMSVARMCLTFLLLCCGCFSNVQVSRGTYSSCKSPGGHGLNAGLAGQSRNCPGCSTSSCRATTHQKYSEQSPGTNVASNSCLNDPLSSVCVGVYVE